MDRLDAIVAAVEYIEDRIADAPSVEEIAAACALSRTHLQRLFSTIVGESVGSYVRKRRLCHAMNLLIESDRGVLDIALEAGFRSQEAFTRAFREYFGMAPATFRKRGDRFSPGLEPRLTRARLAMKLEAATWEPRMASREAEVFVGVRAPFVVAMSDGTNVSDVVPRAWARFEAAAAELPDGPRVALTFPMPSEEQERGDEMCFMAATRVAGVPRSLPAGFTVKETRPAQYAVFLHPGPPEEFSETVNFAFLDWLVDSKFEFDPTLPQHRWFGATADGTDEYWMPVVPRGEPAPWRRDFPFDRDVV